LSEENQRLSNQEKEKTTPVVRKLNNFNREIKVERMPINISSKLWDKVNIVLDKVYTDYRISPQKILTENRNKISMENRREYYEGIDFSIVSDE